MNIAIVGIGLIGGSIALDLRKRGFADRVIGVEKNPVHSKEAVELGVVDEIRTLEDAISISDIIILSTPVDVAQKLLGRILDKIDCQLVIDVGSTKAKLVSAVKNHKNRGSYVATHPMAGTEYSGPSAAEYDLFNDKCAFFCDVEDSSEEAVELATKLYRYLGVNIIKIDSESHDVHAAYVSHISHISSFALAVTVIEKEKDEENILNLASGGFESTVRLAKSSAEMWTPIFDRNSENIIAVIDTYMEKLGLFKKCIENNDKEEIGRMIMEANKIKKIIK